GEPVDDLAFAFIAPLGTDHRDVGQALRLSGNKRRGPRRSCRRGQPRVTQATRCHSPELAFSRFLSTCRAAKSKVTPPAILRRLHDRRFFAPSATGPCRKIGFTRIRKVPG